MSIPRVEINGGPATAGQLAYPAIVNYGHFTAMQVRGGAVRGLDLHLSRLDSATRELFGTGLGGDLVRANIRHERPVAHLKHAGTFGQIWYGQAAERAGFDDALLTGPEGVIAEGAITNIGFFDGEAVVWPDAPMLAGITMQLVTSALAGRGTPIRHAAVRIADLPSFRAVFVTNSLGVAPVGQVDDLVLPADPDFIRDLTEAYDSVPWDRI